MKKTLVILVVFILFCTNSDAWIGSVISSAGGETAADTDSYVLFGADNVVFGVDKIMI